jgi:hypothetical protein
LSASETHYFIGSAEPAPTALAYCVLKRTISSQSFETRKMGWKAFLASIIGSVAWPTAMVIVVLIFRVQLRQLITHVRKIGAGGVNVELAEQVERVRDQAELVEAEQETLPPDVVALDPAILQLAQKYPEAAVLQAYKELENLLLQIRARLPDNRPHRTLNEVLKYLNDKGYVSGSVLSLFKTLRDARNSVAHARDEKMAPGEAIELIRQTRFLMDLLHQVVEKLPPRK